MEKLTSILKEHTVQGPSTANKLLGAAFIVVTEDDVLYSGSSGRIDFDTASKPFSTDTLSWFASMTKIVTITCLMQLVERGVISLDDDTRPLVPELKAMQILRGFDQDDKPILQDNDKPITLRQANPHSLLLKSKGLTLTIAATSSPTQQVTGRTATILDWSREGFTTPLKFPPGEGWYYGSATDWAGLVLEELTGQVLSEYVRDNIFEPLGIRDSGFWPEKLPQCADRTASCTYREGEELKPGPFPMPREHPIESGGSGLFSTADDYAVFFKALLGGKLVREETLREMFSPQLDEVQSGMLEMIAYNIGIQDAFAPEFPKGLRLNHGIGGVMNLDDVPGKRRKGSLMWSGACNTRWWIDRETGIAAGLITNVQPHGDPVVKSLYDKLELAVYESLNKQ
ncbi:hypothetical protein ACJ41O_006970 [Fusarium nematophilum]